MKVLIALACLAAMAAALPENRPSGRLVLLPARQEQEPPTTTPTPEGAANGTKEADESQFPVLSKGEYYVLLEDGRLQMVKYTTAALPAEGDETKQDDSSAAQQPSSARFTQQRYPVYTQAQNAQSAKYSAPAQPEQPKYYAQFPHAQFFQPKEAEQSAKYSAPAQPEPYPFYYVQAENAQKVQDAQSAKYSAPAQPEPYPFYYVQAETAQPQEASNAQSAKYSAPAQPEPYPFYYVQARPAEAEASAKYTAPAQAEQPKYYAQLPQYAQASAKYSKPAEKSEKTAKYTAPAQAEQPKYYAQLPQAARYSQSAPAQSAKYTAPQAVAPAAELQVELVQFPLPGSQFAQTKLQLVQKPEDQEEDQEDQEEDQEQEQPAGFEANLQYRDVKPISAPIYAYNSAPLVRILKK